MEKFHAFFDVELEAENYEDAKEIAKIFLRRFNRLMTHPPEQSGYLGVQLTEVEED